MDPRTSRSASFRASMSTTAGWSRASTSKTCATQVIPSNSPPPTTREGADELTFLDVTASFVGPRHHARGRQTDRRAGVHPAHRRRRCAIGGRRRRAVAGRRRQGRRQHRGDRAPRTAGRTVPPVRVAVHRAVGRRPDRPRGFRSRRRRDGRSPPTADGAAPVSTPSNGPPAAPSWASAKSCSTRWTSTAPRPGST